MLAEFAQKVPDSLTRFGEEVAERTSLELADAVISPSEWLFGWMRDRGWPVPDTARVIPHVWLTAALGKQPIQAQTGMPVRRLAFFGQLREGKGIRVFLDGLNALPTHLLEGVELVFVGRETRRWTARAIEAALDPQVVSRCRSIRFETTLDPPGALAQLRRPGTLTIVPSLLDNAPYTVSECIEHGIPFLAAATGGTPELIAVADQARVLFKPTAPDLANALEVALMRPDGVAPARPGGRPEETVETWLEVIDSLQRKRPAPGPVARRVDVIATGGPEAEQRARRLAEHTQSVEVGVVSAASRGAGLARATADWLLFLDGEDLPDDGLLDTLVSAQATSQADAVTCAVRPVEEPGAVGVFLGSPGSLGLVENHYGVIGLIRRELVPTPPPEGAVDPDWPLFARIALAGALLVSIPEPLSTHTGRAGRLEDVPGEGLAVLRAFEDTLGTELADLPQLATTLATSHARLEADRGAWAEGRIRRGLGVLRTEGVGGFARKASERIRRSEATQ
jgi:hypothetical protein